MVAVELQRDSAARRQTSDVGWAEVESVDQRCQAVRLALKP